GFVRIGGKGPEVGIAEGLETGIAIYLATKRPVLVTLGSRGMKKIKIPRWVKEVCIWADRDRQGIGEDAAITLKKRLIEQDIPVNILIPPDEIPLHKSNIDWLDMYNIDPNSISNALTKIQEGNHKHRVFEKSGFWPSPLKREALHGFLGKYIRVVLPTTEADEASLVIQLLVMFGSLIGRSPHYKVSVTRHGMNLFAVIVGRSAKARKGTAFNLVRDLINKAFPDFKESKWSSGLSTGEGLIQFVQNANESQATGDDITNSSGCLFNETEFGRFLTVSLRTSNILSTTIRDAWDGDKALRTLTRKDPLSAEDPHVSINAQITLSELKLRLQTVDIYNGMGNRFIWICVRRSKMIATPRNPDAETMRDLALEFREIVNFSKNAHEITMDSDTIIVWERVYEELSKEQDGIVGELLQRSEAQVIRIACLYTLLDKETFIRVPHLNAALALWEYAAESVLSIFGSDYLDPKSRRVYEEIKSSPNGLSRTEIRNKFHRHITSEELGIIFVNLTERNLIEQKKSPTKGRPEERWFAKKPI
ncbi:MAG: DUF3987 domain-containing protein, partial [Proteobacteria bacterium]|nr:DUF3987 domain-containing protein [Pseudomonadota bacterium]